MRGIESGLVLEQHEQLAPGVLRRWSAGGQLRQGADRGIGDDRRGLGEESYGCEQTADYGLRQRCGYLLPDPRPLARDVISAGHANASYTRSDPRVNEKRTDGSGSEVFAHTSGLAGLRIARRHAQSVRVSGARAYRACFGITHNP